MENTKKCTKCGRELPLDQFNKRNLGNGKLGQQYRCKDCSSAMNSEWRKNNPEYNVEWQKNNLESGRQRCARWRGGNPDYIHKRRAIDPEFKLIQNIRSAINMALKRNHKAGHTIELIGCSIKYLRRHLENQFIEGMTWDNYGLHGWHIDHIIPLSYFSHSDPDQQKRAWHYTNLRPMWAVDNIRKGNKIIEVQLVLL